MTHLYNYFKAKRGNTALIFALALIPIVAGVGSAVDLARLNQQKTALQAANDATFFYTIKQGQFATPALKDIANDKMKINTATLPLTNIVTNLQDATTTAGQELTLNTSAKLPTYFLGVFGKNEFVINVSSSGVTNSSGTEVVFVLDTTASMNDNNKIVSLRTSVNNILDSLLNSAGENVSEIKVGIVPFNTQVRIEPSINDSYVNYGKADGYQSCSSDGTNNGAWPNCQVYWWNLDSVCYSSSNRAACKATAVAYDRPVYVSNGKKYYEQVIKAYTLEKNNKYTVHSHKIVYWWVDATAVPGATDETGQQTNWVGGSSGLTTDTQTNTGNQANFNNINVAPTYSSGGIKNMIKLSPYKYEQGYWNGYDANIANNWDYSIFGNTIKRNATIPATTASRSSWTGCLTDREQNFDTNAEAANSSNINSLYIAKPCDYMPLETVLPLTLDIAKAKAKVTALSPAGYTNITIGIQYGMEVLSPNAPMTGGSNFDDLKNKKFMVIITDGFNNRNRFTGDVAEVDKRTALACVAAKAKGITLFVVRLEEGNSELLKTCASTPPYYYNLTSASQLSSALSSMFTAIGNSRLTK